MKKHRIVHIITGLQTGGAEMMLFKLLSSMTHAEFDQVVVTMTGPGPVGNLIKGIGVPVYDLEMIPGRPSLRALSRLKGVLADSRPALVQGWMYHANIAGSFCRLLMLNRFPVLWNIRQSLDHIGDEKRSTYAVIRLGARLSGLPRAIIYNSRHSMSQHVELGYNRNRSIVIPNGFDSERFRPDEAVRAEFRRNLGVSDRDVLVGMVARFHPMKDHENFIHAAGLLCSRYDNIRFLLVGQGLDSTNAEVRSMLVEHGVTDKVMLLGERSDIPAIIASLDIAALSSSSEAFPNVIGEAMACGVPCVSTAVGDAGWILADAGKIVPVRDPYAMAAGWGELINAGAEYRRQLGERGRHRITECFTMHSIASRYEELYQAVIRRNPVPDSGPQAC